jgi:uncharacterized protein (TIGR00369 family)
VTQTQKQTETRRVRTFEWTAPGTRIEVLVGLNGLEQLRAVADGRVPAPPIFNLMDMQDFETDPGRVVVTMRAQEFHYNPLGGVHGGVIATLLDTAAGCSVHSTLDVGQTYTSLDLTTKFLRPVTVDSGLLRCEGRVISRGRRTALAQAELSDQAGRLVAYATSTCLIISG